MNRTDTPYRHSSRLNKKRRSGSGQRDSNVKPRLAIDTDLCRYASFKPTSPSIYGQDTLQPHTKQTARYKAVQHPACELPRSAAVYYDRSEDSLVGTILHADRNPSTPTVIVTPALAEQATRLQLPLRQRAASSIYSRCIDDRPVPQDEAVPPVPPIPQQHLTDDPRDPLRVGIIPPRRNYLAKCSPALAGVAFSRNGLLSARSTPSKSSHGWWNFILSPFSARSDSSFWRTPSLYHEERTPMLSDVQGSSRSLSDPQAPNTTDELNIYRTPSQGEAAAYYDQSRHYPSVISSPAEDIRMETVVHDAQHEAEIPRIAVETQSDGDTRFTSPDASELATPIFPDSDHQSEVKSCSSHHKEEASPHTAALSDGLAARTMASRPASSQHKREQATNLVTSRNANLDQPLGLGIFANEKQATVNLMQVADHNDSNGDRGSFLRDFSWPVIALAFATTALIVVMLVIYVPKQHQDIPIQAQWVNTTAFPPFFVGILTIIQPRLVRDDSKCVSQPEIWSCRSVVAGGLGVIGNRTMPDFRFEIRFRNDTTFNSSALTAQHTSRRRSVLLSRPISGWEAQLTARDLWDDQKYNAVPSPPSQADQIFMGNTTDNVTLPYDGESTPFFMTFVNSNPLRRNHKRGESVYPLPNDGGTTTTGTARVAAPHTSIDSDGKALPMLFSMASAQPIRLYKRGMPDEHYGFYTYYDRSIIVDLQLANNTKGRSICTWSQSRFLIQIWTKSLRKSSAVVKGDQAAANVQAVDSSANVMDAPGSFPYATTITLDRHGGDVNSKGVFCRPLDEQGRAAAQGTWVAEDRATGGAPIRPGSIPGGVNDTIGAIEGLIDGGTGGCACAWANW